MKLKVDNIGKIEKATIEVDGITVIAGENNTGKSTIGKLIYAIFNSMNNMDKKIENQKKNKIFNVLSVLLSNYAINNEFSDERPKRFNSLYLDSIVNDLVGILNKEEDDDIVKEEFKNLFANSKYFSNLISDQEFIDDCITKTRAVENVSDKKVMTEVITRWFDSVFINQISPLFEQGITSNVELTIKNKNLDFVFQDDECVNVEANIKVLHEAFYIDNPFVIDYMSYERLVARIKSSDRHLIRQLNKSPENAFDGVFDTVLVKDKLNEVYKKIGEIVGGEFIENNEGEYCLRTNKFTKPLNIKNLSTGLKSFAILKRLLENGSLKEKDILILDEPEIHLHPEWQLAYAEIIVLLQKQFDLTMIITTHSPYFLDAIDVYSRKYNLADRVNFYLAENDGDVSTLFDVSDNIELIYKKLSNPMQKLENLRYTLDFKGE